MITTGSVMGLSAGDIRKAIQHLYDDDMQVFVDIGDCKLHMVETIKHGELEHKNIVILRAF